MQGALQVVGHHDDGQPLIFVEIGQRPVQILCGGGVQPRHRLVQDQQPPGGAQRPCQQHPLLLSAGQLPVAPILQFQYPQLAHVHQRLRLLGGGVEEPPSTGAEKARQHYLADGGGKIPLSLGLLGQIAHRPGGLTSPDDPLQRRQQPQQALEKRGLAGAVFPHDTQVFPRMYREGQMFPHGVSLVAQRHVPAGQQRFLIHQASPSFSAAIFCRISDR